MNLNILTKIVCLLIYFIIYLGGCTNKLRYDKDSYLIDQSSTSVSSDSLWVTGYIQFTDNCTYCHVMPGLDVETISGTKYKNHIKEKLYKKRKLIKILNNRSHTILASQLHIDIDTLNIKAIAIYISNPPEVDYID